MLPGLSGTFQVPEGVLQEAGEELGRTVARSIEIRE
jgi:hypothetical protein